MLKFEEPQDASGSWVRGLPKNAIILVVTLTRVKERHGNAMEVILQRLTCSRNP